MIFFFFSVSWIYIELRKFLDSMQIKGKTKYTLSNPHAKSELLFTLILEVKHITNHEIQKQKTMLIEAYTFLSSSFWRLTTSKDHSLISFWSSTRTPALFATDKFWDRKLSLYLNGPKRKNAQYSRKRTSLNSI